jgi:opacity protein-like surface antigen
LVGFVIMKKQYIAFLSLFGFSSLSFGSGFYGGAQLGVGSSIIKKDTHSIIVDENGQLDPRFSPLTAEHDNVSGSGLTGTFYLGYFWNFAEKLGLGFEGQINGNTGKAKQFIRSAEHDQFLNYATQEQVKNYYGLAIKPAYFINEKTKLYAKLGWVRGKLEISSPDGGDVLGATGNLSKTLSGGQIGIGSEFFLTSNLALNLEYSYIKFKEASFTTTSPSLDANQIYDVNGKKATFQRGTANYHPKSSYALIGLTYYLEGEEESSSL